MVKLYVSLLMLADDVKFRLRREDSGATAVEYGLLVGLIAVVIIVAVALIGTKPAAPLHQRRHQDPAAAWHLSDVLSRSSLSGAAAPFEPPRSAYSIPRLPLRAVYHEALTL